MPTFIFAMNVLTVGRVLEGIASQLAAIHLEILLNACWNNIKTLLSLPLQKLIDSYLLVNCICSWIVNKTSQHLYTKTKTSNKVSYSI